MSTKINDDYISKQTKIRTQAALADAALMNDYFVKCAHSYGDVMKFYSSTWDQFTQTSGSKEAEK